MGDRQSKRRDSELKSQALRYVSFHGQPSTHHTRIMAKPRLLEAQARGGRVKRKSFQCHSTSEYYDQFN
jgi:hypothetical protein